MARLLAALACLWALGFALFASSLPHPAGNAPTDGIVVLTGGPGRLQRGLLLLRQGAARRMLISGVDRRVRPAELAHAYHVPEALFARIDLGHESVDTHSNAEETARWVAAHHYRSIRLVTTDWHMRRARLELSHTLGPQIAVLPDGVPSDPALGPLLREYNKYLLRRVASLFGY